MVQFAFEKDEERKKVMLKTLETVTLPNFLKNMEKLLVARGGEHFAGNEVTFGYFRLVIIFFNGKAKIFNELSSPGPSRLD